MKSDDQRGPFGSWLRRERIRAGFGNVPAAVDALKRQAGYGIAPSVWAELESGSRRPSEEQRQRLTAFFGTTPQVAEAGDLSAVVAAISSQTEVLRRIADHLEAQPSPAQENLRTIVALAVEGTLQVLVERGLLAAPPERDGAPAQQGRR